MTIDMSLRYLAVASRIGMAALFLHEAWFKITHLDLTIAYMERYGVPRLLLPGAIAVELIGGLALTVGYRARAAALVLAGFCVMTALLFHLNSSDQNQLLHFEKDFAIAGGLLAFAIGPLIAQQRKQQPATAVAQPRTMAVSDPTRIIRVLSSRLPSKRRDV